MIYFIRQAKTAAVKIGYTADAQTLATRLATLQSASAFRLRVIFTWQGDISDERALHRRFAEHRLQGEWFRYSVEMAKYFAACKAARNRYAASIGPP